MSTAWCLSVAFLTPWVIGAPVVWLARGCRRLRTTDWLWVPFFGLAAIICPLQTLAVYADLPLVRTVPWFWLAAGVTWAAFVACPSGRWSLSSIPWRAVAVAAAVFIGQGAGVVVRGVECYRGNLQSDQYQYVVLAQFLADEPFSTDDSAAAERPWLVAALRVKPDRLGQSVIHGYYAVTTGHNALDLFFPTLLLGPALLVPAMLLLAAQCSLPRRWAVWAAVTAGLTPGVELLVSLCFLSHVLCVPVLMVFCAAVIRLARGGGLRSLTDAMVAFVLGFAVYTEFAPLFAGVTGVALTAGLMRRHIGFTRAAGVTVALILSLGLNPAAVAGAVTVWERGAADGASRSTGHRTAVWVASIWLHFDKAGTLARRAATTSAHAALYAGMGAAAVGGGVFLLRAVRSRTLLPSLACAALFIPPAGLRAIRPEAAYAVGKLVLTLTPLVVLFTACGASAVARYRPGGGRRAVSLLAWLFTVVLCAQSGQEQWAWLRRGRDVGPARVWNDPNLQHLCAVLREQEPSDVVIALTRGDGAPTPAFAAGALCYYDRHHRIRLVSPTSISMADFGAYQTFPSDVVDALDPGTLVVVRRGALALRTDAHQIALENEAYQLIRVVTPPANRSTVSSH